jgi:hypothetical protein
VKVGKTKKGKNRKKPAKIFYAFKHHQLYSGHIFIFHIDEHRV